MSYHSSSVYDSTIRTSLEYDGCRNVFFTLPKKNPSNTGTLIFNWWVVRAVIVEFRLSICLLIFVTTLIVGTFKPAIRTIRACSKRKKEESVMRDGVCMYFWLKDFDFILRPITEYHRSWSTWIDVGYCKRVFFFLIWINLELI